MSFLPNQKNEASASNTSEHNTALTVTITSGKGGVGKTNITTNLGIALAQAGQKVCVFDADTSLANINILLGLHPKLTLEHFLNGDHSIDEIMLNAPESLKVIPAASGISQCANLNGPQQNKLLVALEQLERQFDYLLVDSAAGISNSVLDFIQSSQYAVVVISPEPTSLTDAFSLIKMLQRRDCDQPIYILVNICNGYAHSMEVFKRFAHAVNKFINAKVRYLGYIPNDPALKSAVSTQSPVILSAPNAPASRCLSLLAQILVKHFTPANAPDKSISQFWRSQLSMRAHPEALSAKPLESEHPKRAPASCSHSGIPLERASLEGQLLNSANHYLEKYGALPDSLINLVKQNHPSSKDEPRPQQPVKQSCKQQSLATHSMGHATANTEATACQIEKLVAQATSNKAQLTARLLSLQAQYQELYQSLPNTIDEDSGAAKPKNTETQSEDQRELLQSIGYAAIVDE